jgi:hypothetical protein
MPMTYRLRQALLPVFLTAISFSCAREEPPPIARRPAAQAPAPPPLPLGAAPGSDDPAPSATAAEAIIPAGEWTENKTYRFRFERIAACGAPVPSLGPAQPPATGAAANLRGEASWVGAYFSVQAKEPSVFVSPRDLELRRGGVILNARYTNQPLLAGCQPLLPAKQLKNGESSRGFALFEVPKSFRIKTEDPIVLSYRPTRWGGARQVEVPIRECLDACPEPSAGKASGTAGRSTGAPRTKL